MEITIKIRMAWWVAPYLQTVAAFAFAFGVDPAPEKVANAIVALGGIKTEVA